ncbi:MAG: DNA adenine methylase, partial [Anaerolineae bacterium]
MTIRRPALRYHGGKWRIEPWIIGHFPPHTCYCEPYGGAMSVLLRKAPSYCEVYNDVDQEVVCFFKVLRERPDELIRAIELTPFSRFELGQAFEPAGDELERARRLYIRSWQGRGGPRAKWRTGWRRQKVATKSNGQKKMTPATRSFMQTDHLMVIAERLRGVEIDCEPALKVIERYDSPVTLFYLDPPYVSSTRNRWKKHAYAHEMTDKQHRQLARAVHDLQGMALISGY